MTFCTECGNGEAVDGYELCSDCLIGQISDGRYVLWCERCLVSLMWMDVDADTYPEGEWGSAVAWAASEAHPHTCFGEGEEPTL